MLNFGLIPISMKPIIMKIAIVLLGILAVIVAMVSESATQ
jgi:hypothetical protein